MAGLTLKGIYKKYPGGVVAVSDVNLEIRDKEFIVLVGPSGCGKSTTLRMIAGLEEISEGELYIGDRLVNDIAPKDRDIAMVFQNYALYPHMTVFDNMAFGLKLRKVPKDEIERKVNEEALEQYLSFQYSVLPETFFKGIFRLPAGHYMIFKDGKLDVQRYFDPMMEPAMDGDLEKTVSEIEEVVHDTVDAHMIADVEVGSLLSSGVDSSYVVSEFPGNKTFTVGFLDKQSKYNEIRYAEGLVRELGKNNYNKNIDSEEYFKSIPTVMYYMDEPLADPSCIALYFVDKLAAEQIKVVLSGEGADEFFGGYNIYHEPISLKGYQKIPKCVRKGLAAVAKKMPDIKGRDFIIRGSKTVEERFIGNANMFSVEDREKLLKTKLTHKTPQDIVADAYKKVSHLNDIAKMQYIDTNFWLQGDILLKADKMSMAHCLESRVPFLDVKVFDYAKKLPIDFRCNDEATKRAFRIAAKRHIPEATANKKKLGFPVPIRVWLKEDNYYNKVMETLTGEAAQKFFNTDILVKLMEDHRAGKADNSRRIWTVYVFLVWYKVYFEDEDFRPINQDWIDNRVRTAQYILWWLETILQSEKVCIKKLKKLIFLLPRNIAFRGNM